MIILGMPILVNLDLVHFSSFLAIEVRTKWTALTIHFDQALKERCFIKRDDFHCRVVFTAGNKDLRIPFREKEPTGNIQRRRFDTFFGRAEL